MYRRPLGKYRYTIFYRVLPSEERIEVARVIHGARVKNLRTLPSGE
jgi:plasmid stabilization system protein ParE